MSKIKSNNIQKQKYLIKYLIQKDYTLKDLKCEIILLVCDMLIDNYLIEENDCNREISMDYFTNSERNLIYQTMKDLQNDIHQNILTIDKIQEIINSHYKNKNSLNHARLVDSVQYFYNSCVNNIQSLLILNSINKNEIKWIPDLLCIYLIQDMKERDYFFDKFLFLDSYNFDNLFLIYQKTNSILKNSTTISISTERKTIINCMENISYKVVERLLNIKYR